MKRLSFSDTMMLQWLAGRKTLTSRVIPSQDPDDRPPYEAGEEVAVTEAFRVFSRPSGPWRPGVTVDVAYRACGHYRCSVLVPETHWERPTAYASETWYPPRFMPVWASRRRTTILSCTPERLQSLTPLELCWEGFDGSVQSSRDFPAYWDELNAQRGYPFNSNPWTWRILIEPPQ